VTNVTDKFSKLTGELDYPMLIVTTRAEGEQDGCLVGFATQCSIDPPRFLVCLSNQNRTYRLARRATMLAVHLIPSDNLEIARLFGSETGDDVDKLKSSRWRPGPSGVPILEACPRWFAGRILERIPMGDHDAFVLEPVAVGDGGNDEEGGGDGDLRFEQVKTLDPGHEA
jgi:flavin reductase (DIM6/NTAB) family NADH-FMN oxidoreductase RutF